MLKPSRIGPKSWYHSSTLWQLIGTPIASDSAIIIRRRLKFLSKLYGFI